MGIEDLRAAELDQPNSHDITWEQEAMLPENRLILQSDWEESLRERNGKAWVIFKSSAPPSLHSELTSHGQSTEGAPNITSIDARITVSNITTKSLVITYTGEESNLSRKFLCPSVTYSSIHPQHKQVVGLDVSPGGLGASSDSGGGLTVWQTDTGEVRRQLCGHVGSVYSVRFFPSGRVLLTAGGDMVARIWSVETGECAATLMGHRAGICDTAIIDRGRNVVTGARDGTAVLWDVGRQQALHRFEGEAGQVNCCQVGQPPNSLAMGPPPSTISDREVMTEGKLLLLGCENSTLQGYGLQSRAKVFSLACESAVNACSFLSEQHVVCATQEGCVWLLDLRHTSSPLRKWKESRGPFHSLLPHKGGFFATTGDGSCFHVDDSYQTTVELSGPDCDPVYQACTDGSSVFTSCRDGRLRRYSLNCL